jgi:dihydroxy-acid dehydratase
MTEKFRSFTITKGVPRSPNRSMLRAIGYTDADFDKPVVGIANGHSTMNPCNAGIQPLADAADTAARKSGAMPQMFGTITVTDGISMGTEGMKYSLVSREVIADAIETAAQSQFMDGVLAIGGCDKNLPGAMIGVLRMNVRLPPTLIPMTPSSQPRITWPPPSTNSNGWRRSTELSNFAPWPSALLGSCSHPV